MKFVELYEKIIGKRLFVCLAGMILSTLIMLKINTLDLVIAFFSQILTLVMVYVGGATWLKGKNGKST
ncbi:MAG: hypothetical protein EHM45_17420 [Desulfobacteraceae bacterium]|nr:MAG: hypothetical protein EHM45_17420 [Desulfobacteraceae bacterium]